eukprot:12020816-Alexandrium_andersonii.AAC.1
MSLISGLHKRSTKLAPDVSVLSDCRLSDCVCDICPSNKAVGRGKGLRPPAAQLPCEIALGKTVRGEAERRSGACACMLCS